MPNNELTEFVNANDCVPILQEYGEEEVTFVNPTQFPDRSQVLEYLEPMVVGTIITPDEFIGKIMTMCLVSRIFSLHFFFNNESVNFTVSLYLSICDFTCSCVSFF